MSDPILETRALKRHFVTRRPLLGQPTVVHAVDGVDLRIEAGETFAIVGESGCGKSTLARMLVRLIEPSEGAVRYQGRDISHLPEAEMRALRRDLQFIFQDPFSSLNPRMSVGALIEEPLSTHGIGTPAERRVKVAELLGRVGLLPAHADRYPHEFSGGQRQRIGIARALATGPKVIVGDEPVSALDVSIQAQVVNILQDLKQDFGLTLVVIAHDLAVIRHMADRVAVMYLGQIVELAPARALFDTPRHPYTAALVGAIPVPRIGGKSDVAPLQGDLPDPTSPPQGCRFHTRCPHVLARCKTEVPALQPVDGHMVACHRAPELTLAGLPAQSAFSSAATEARFRLYRAARAAQTPEPEKPKTERILR